MNSVGNIVKKCVFSGIKPSGDIHIGNYFGAIKQWVDSQNKFSNIFCVVDMHAITVPQEPKVLKSKIRELAGLLLASGIDLKKSALFVQSDVSAHTELAWILNCFIPMGWMERMTQFKEKSGKLKERASVGLFDYPALMAADILLYQTDFVPVGEDQKQHLELTRDVAVRFNAIYGKTFKIPKAVIAETGARIMGLADPTKKMAKSEKMSGQAVYLLDSPDEIRGKIMAAPTDSLRLIRFDKNRPGIYNLLIIYELFSGLKRKEIETRFDGKGYADLKRELAELVIEKLKPIQLYYRQISSDKSYIDSVLKDGAERIRPIAEKTLETVKEKIGLG